MPNAGRKLVALAIADMANDEGYCWPSIRSLAARCNMRPEAIADHLSALAAVGILSKESRFRDGKQASNYYIMAPISTLTQATIVGGVEIAPPAKITGGRGVEIAPGEGGGNRPPESSDRTVIRTVTPQPPPIGVVNTPHKANAITPKQLKDLWETHCPSFPKVSEITAARLKSAKARGTPERLANVFAMVESSDLLTGRSPTKEFPNWKATIDWVLNPSNFAKIAEGNYTNKPRTNPQRSDSANAPGRYD